MTEQAKMQPFYVAINHEGKCVDGHHEGDLIRNTWPNHRIEHMRDQSAFVEELRALRSDYMHASFDEDTFFVKFDAILSRHGE